MEILGFVALFVVCYLISGVVHELGHIGMGLREGFKFHLLVVGPFGLRRDERDRIAWYFEKDVSLWGGMGATIPTRAHPDNYKKFGRVLLAGPLASLIFGAVFLPIGMIHNSMFFLLLGAMPLSMGAVSLVPLRNGAFYTDGGRWLRMHKNESTKAVEVAIWNITQDAIVQGSYGAADLLDIRTLTGDNDARTRYLGHYFAYCFYKENKDDAKRDEEIAELAKLRSQVPKQMVSLFRVDHLPDEKNPSKKT